MEGKEQIWESATVNIIEVLKESLEASTPECAVWEKRF